MAEFNPTPSASYTVPDLKEDDGEKYHVFIAQSSEDAEFSHKMLEALEEIYRLKCFHSDRDFAAGVSVVNNSLHGVRSSRHVLLLITTDFLKSDWYIFETQQAITKSYTSQRRVMVPVLKDIQPGDVPTEVKAINYLTWGEERFWQRLEKALTEDIPLSSAIPAGNVAHGLAWSYFYGFLNLVLPGMRNRIMESEFHQRDDQPCCMKMLIMLPKSCKCPTSFSEEDANFSYSGFIPFIASRAGNKNRDYKSSLYSVENAETKKKYLFIGEFATPLHSLYEMELGEIAGLRPEEKLHQYMLFCDKLKEILQHGNNQHCHEKAILVQYDDAEITKNPHYLSTLVARKIQHELDKEAMSNTMLKVVI